MGIAVAEILQQGFTRLVAVDPPGEPDLAGAALDFVFGGVLGLRHRIERAAEFDDIPVAIVPIVQQRKIVPDFVDRHRVPRSMHSHIYRLAVGRKRYPGTKTTMVPVQSRRHGAVRHSAITSSRVSVSPGAAGAKEASAIAASPIEPVWSDARLSVMI